MNVFPETNHNSFFYNENTKGEGIDRSFYNEISEYLDDELNKFLESNNVYLSGHIEGTEYIFKHIQKFFIILPIYEYIDPMSLAKSILKFEKCVQKIGAFHITLEGITYNKFSKYADPHLRCIINYDKLIETDFYKKAQQKVTNQKTVEEKNTKYHL